MVQTPIRQYNGNTYGVQEGADILQEIEQRTAHTDEDLNTTAQMAPRIKNERVEEIPNLTGIHTIDWNTHESHDWVIVGNVMVSAANPPAAGLGKTITIKATGDYSLTLPIAWSTGNGVTVGSYDGTKINLIVVQSFGDDSYWVTIVQDS